MESYILDSTELSVVIILILIITIPIARRAYSWIHIGDPPPIAQNKRLIIGLIGALVLPAIIILCFLAAALLKILLPYLLAAGAAVIIVLIIRKVKKNQDDRYNQKESYSQPKKPHTIKKTGRTTSAKKYKMRY